MLSFTQLIKRKFLLFLYFNAVLHNTFAAKYQARNIKFVSVNMKGVPKHLQNVSTWITNDTMNMECELMKDLVTGFMTHFDIQIRLADSKSFQTMFAYDFDICAILNQLYRMNLGHAWFTNTLKYSNLKQNCPIEAGHYYIHDMVIEAPSIPSYLGSGDYRVSTLFYYGKSKSKKVDKVGTFTTDLKLV